jgi:hypothetical protein
MHFFSLLLLLSGACVPLAHAQSLILSRDTIATRLLLPGADCALFPVDARLPNWLDISVTRNERFTPTSSQAAQVEKALPDAQLQKLYEHSPPSYYASYPTIIKQHLPNYQRQYYGFYNKRHQPCLVINFFYEPNIERPSNPIPYWLRAPISMSDGGPAYWSIYYNLTTHRFYNFSHNLEG